MRKQFPLGCPTWKASAVAYCSVESLDAALEKFSDSGAVLYRGPLTVEDGRRVCQLRDPFGNVLGLIGP